MQKLSSLQTNQRGSSPVCTPYCAESKGDTALDLHQILGEAPPGRRLTHSSSRTLGTCATPWNLLLPQSHFPRACLQG
jgi:hypothetical protein